jgi:tetratricopeptide (TPR) repeat protein
MKKFIFLSSLFSILILATLAAKIYQEQDKKISAFNSSLKYEEKKDYDNALKTLTQNYEENKNSYLINLRLGWLYYSKGDNTKSKNYYQQACAIEKNSTEAILGLTLPLAKLEDWDNIVNLYQKALKIDSNNFYANLYLGQIYLNRTDYKKAKDYFQKIYDLNPSSYDANLYLGWAQYYLGNLTEARELFTNVLMISADDKSATNGLTLTK